MVRHDVENLSHAECAELLTEACQGVFPAEKSVYLVIIYCVIAMRAAASRLQIRRTVDVGHTQLLQISDDRRRAVEAQSGMQLESISRSGGRHKNPVRDTAPHMRSGRRNPRFLWRVNESDGCGSNVTVGYPPGGFTAAD